MKDKYRKLSLFELGIILRNDLYNLLNKSGKVFNIIPVDYNDKMEKDDLPIHVIEGMMNSRNYRKKDGNVDTSKEACNLWTNPDACSAEDLIQAIDKNKVWKFMDKLYEFKINEIIEIAPFDPEYKWLG